MTKEYPLSKCTQATISSLLVNIRAVDFFPLDTTKIVLKDLCFSYVTAQSLNNSNNKK